MIIRRRHNGKYTIIPNAIFIDKRLSVEAKGVLGYLLSRPANWEVRLQQLQGELRVGRDKIQRIIRVLINAGYVERDDEQPRDEENKFTAYNYVVRDVPAISSQTGTDVVAFLPQPEKPATVSRSRETRIGRIRTESNKSPSTNPPLPPTPEPVVKLQDNRVEYTQLGRSAQASGLYPVYEGSKGYRLWLAFRGPDAMPPFDRMWKHGQERRIVWLPSLFPPHDRMRATG